MATKSTKKITVQGVELTLKPVTFGQFMEFGKIIENVKIGTGDSPFSAVGKFIHENLIDVLNLAFRGQEGFEKIDWQQADAVEVWEIYEDFLLINAGLKAKLQGLVGNLISSLVPQDILKRATAMK